MIQSVHFIKRRGLRIFLLFLFIVSACPTWAALYDFALTIIDENNEPLIGVNVYTDDYSFSAVTDLDGKVILTDLSTTTELNFTYIGYQSLKLPFYKIRKQNGKIQMLPVSKELATVVVIGRTDEAPEDIPFVVNSISQKQLEFTNPQTAADALASHGDVFVQKSQMGGGSPIVRGFEANKVLLVLDGVRMNNAIFRNGHLQNAISVDNSMLERVEVIFGPGSLMYGSEALGGVVHFRSKNPKLMLGVPQKGQDYIMETNAYTRYASANEEKTGHFDINYGNKNWGSLTSFTVTDYNDLRAGSKRPEAFPNFGKRYHFATRDEEENVDKIIENAFYEVKNGDTTRTANSDLQIGTEYTQIDLAQKVRYRPNDKLDFIGNFQYSTTSDIPRYDQLSIIVRDSSDLKWSEWYYGPQQRFLASLKTKITAPTSFYDKATLIASFQKVDEERYKRKFANIHRNFNVEDVYVYSLTADLDKALDAERRRVMSYGFDINHNNVRSIAGTTNITTGAKNFNEPTRYPSGGSKMTTAAAYANYRWKSIDSLLTLNLGARYTYARVHALFSETDPIPWPESYYTTGIGTTDSDLTWGAGLTMNTPTKWQIRVLLASAFRSPNVDDFSQVRVKNGYVSTPNPNLSSERAINGEITIAKEIGGIQYMGEDKTGTSLKISGTAFYTRLQDAIVRKDFPLLNGETTLFIDEEFNTTQANVNAASAFIYGLSGNVLFNIADKWQWKSSISWTKGRQSFQDTVFVEATDLEMAIDTLVPLAHIPPLYGQTGLSYQFKKFKIEGLIRFNASKRLEEYAVTAIGVDDDGKLVLDRDGSSDNLDYSPNEEGTYGWMTYNIYTSWQMNEKFSLNVGVENLADLHYRLFASGVSAPGRNFIVSLRGTF